MTARMTRKYVREHADEIRAAHARADRRELVENDRVPGLRVIDIIAAAGDPAPGEEFLRQVRLLDCVREIVERAHGPAYWSLIYRAADRLRREKAARLAATGESWET